MAPNQMIPPELRTKLDRAERVARRESTELPDAQAQTVNSCVRKQHLPSRFPVPEGLRAFLAEGLTSYMEIEFPLRSRQHYEGIVRAGAS